MPTNQNSDTHNNQLLLVVTAIILALISFLGAGVFFISQAPTTPVPEPTPVVQPEL